MPIPPNVIPAPESPPLRYGIFRVANGPHDMPDRMRQSGITYDAWGCGTARGYPAECDDTPPTKAFDTNDGEDTALPFVVYTSITCGTAGYSPEYLTNKIRAKLLSVEQAGVEEAFWSGAIGGVTLANSPTLQGVTTLTATTGLFNALGVLEDHAAGVYGYTATIHAEPRLAALMGQGGMLREEGGTLYTPFGSKVSFGGGYPGTSPAGAAAAAGHAWIYITGQVTLWRAPDIFTPPPGQVLDRTLNQYKLLAEREWLATYDCFAAAIDVTL